jgi:hypothetical protein
MGGFWQRKAVKNLKVPENEFDHHFVFKTQYGSYALRDPDSE